MSVPDSSKIDCLPPLRAVIAQHKLRAQKALGQNFLLDQNITDKITRQAGDLSELNIFEVGPGPGGLTRSLLRAGAKSVTAIEFDPRAVAALQDLKAAAQGRLTVIEGNALKIDLRTLAPAPRAIIANLPYNIATPLIVEWLRHIHADAQAYKSLTLMVQKEVALRLSARPNTKAYGRLSILCQWLCNVNKCFDLSPAAFTPPPKVTSSVVQFVPRALGAPQPDFEAVERVTAAAFGQRRKMIRTSLKTCSAALEALGLEPSLRAENLSVEDFIALAKMSSSI